MGKSHFKVTTKAGSLIFKTHKGFINILICNIICCKSEGNYTTIIQEGGLKHTICKTLKIIENELVNFGFIRCHNKWIINGSKAKSFCSKRKEINLSTIDVPISRRKFDEVCQKLLAGNITDKRISQI